MPITIELSFLKRGISVSLQTFGWTRLEWATHHSWRAAQARSSLEAVLKWITPTSWSLLWRASHLKFILWKDLSRWIWSWILTTMATSLVRGHFGRRNLFCRMLGAHSKCMMSSGVLSANSTSQTAVWSVNRILKKF